MVSGVLGPRGNGLAFVVAESGFGEDGWSDVPVVGEAEVLGVPGFSEGTCDGLWDGTEGVNSTRWGASKSRSYCVSI